jgi:hypothetical protein
MCFPKKYAILLFLLLLAAGFPVSSFSRDQGRGPKGWNHQAQSGTNRMPRAQNPENPQHDRQGNPGRQERSNPALRNQFAERDNHGRKDGEHERRERANRDRRYNFNFGFIGGDGYAYPYGYSDNHYYPDNGYYQGQDDPYDIGYSDGYSAGQYDHLNGFIYNPRQYERSDNPDYFEGFVAGYRDGWIH